MGRQGELRASDTCPQGRKHHRKKKKDDEWAHLQLLEEEDEWAHLQLQGAASGRCFQRFVIFLPLPKEDMR